MLTDAGVLQPADVVVQLAGGLGNQLFQYATALALADARGGKILLDTRALRRLASRGDVTPRELGLDDLRISGRVASDHELIAGALDWRVLPSPRRWIPGRAWRALQRAASAQIQAGYVVYRESSLNWDSHFSSLTRAPGLVYLIGFWQSESYFRAARPKLVREIQPSLMSKEVSELRQEIADQRSLIVHVRRGDFLRDARTRRFHGVLSGDYYRRAVRMISNRINIDSTFIFCEDADLGGFDRTLAPNCRVVTQSHIGGRAVDHLSLMTAGSAFVLANSSFSWWAAWLSGVPDDLIVGPEPWYAAGKLLSGPMPASWARVQTTFM